MLVTTTERARALGLTPMVRFHTGTVVGADPVVMLGAPWPATHKVLARVPCTVAAVAAGPATLPSRAKHGEHTAELSEGSGLPSGATPDGG